MAKVARSGETLSRQHRERVGDGQRRSWERRFAQGYVGKGPVAQLNAIKRLLRTDHPVLSVRWLEESHRDICFRLQQCVQVHKLGLGGEHTVQLVCDKLDDLIGKSSKGWS